MPSLQILLVHPHERRRRLQTALETAGHSVEIAETATGALETLSTAPFDCLVSCFDLPGDDGLALGSAVDQLAPETPFVLFAGHPPDDATIDSSTVDGAVDHYVRANGESSVTQLVSVVEQTATQETQHPPKQDIAGAEPSTDDLARAIEEAPIGISLSDPTLDDYPLVYANDAWEAVTGYPTDDVLGRNPRLLQGPETDSKTTDRLADAIENEEPLSVEIRNYKRDGTPFWNELTVAPVYENGELAHYVGFQIDVTDRREAEALAEERARKLDDQRQALQRVLNRVNGLLSEISGILVESTDRQQIEYNVCDTIATEPGYAAAWICRTTPGEQSVTLSASSGLPTQLPSEFSLDELPVAIRRAHTTDEIQQCSTAETETPTPLDPARMGARRLLVVPLSYGDRQFGLLGVYGTDIDALDKREQQVFASVGRMIANGIHSVEATRILTSDHVTELKIAVRDETFQLSRLAAAVGAPVSRCGTTSTDSSDCELYFRTEATVDIETVASLSFVQSARIVSSTDAETTVSVRLSAVEPDTALAELGAVVTEMTATPQTATLTVEAPPQLEVRTLLDSLRESYDSVELRARTDSDRRNQHPAEFAAAVDDRLTDRQQAALKAAQLNGYFEWPRPVDGDEIAETMGITRQTFHQHLRAAEQKLVEAYVNAG